jgi:Tfp pilus assembly protein PilO
MKYLNFNRFNLLNAIPIIIVACFLLVIILGAVVLLPKFQELREIQKNIAEKEEELRSQESYFAELREIKTKLEKYQEQLTKINAALPDEQSLPSLFDFLQKTSSQSGLILKGIGPFTISPSEDDPNLRETQFSFQVLGSYSSFKNFLLSLEKSARMIEVENISFSSPKEEDNLFVFNLRIKVYSY